MSGHTLVLSGVTYSYPGAAAPAVEGLDIEVEDGTLVGLIGPNGAGKSTVLKVAAGLVRPASGRVLVTGIELSSLSRREAARRVAMVPVALQAAMPVRDLVALGRTPHLTGLFESRRDREAISDALALVRALDLARRDFNRLSAGEQKRVLIARALAQEPRLLLLDEPTANLDIAQGVAVLERIKDLARARGMAVLAAIHDLNLALLFCDRVALMRAGRLRACGRPESALSPEAVSEVFGCDLLVGREGGRAFILPAVPGKGTTP